MSTLYYAGAICSYLHHLCSQVDSVTGAVSKETATENDHLRRLLSCFELNRLQPAAQVRYPLEAEERHLIAVYANLLQRGLPTFSSVRVERTVLSAASILTEKSGLTFSKASTGKELRFSHHAANRSVEKAWLKALNDAYVAIDPRVTPQQLCVDKFDSEEERLFYQHVLPKAIGNAATLWVAPQRPFSSLLLPPAADKFVGQRVDFALEGGTSRWIIEVDGLQHYTAPLQQKQDQERNKALESANWLVTRISTQEIKTSQTISVLQKQACALHWVQRLEAAYQQPLWNDPLRLAALHVVLAPYAVVRLQRAMLLALENGVLTFDEPQWTLVIFERDVHCAELAVLDFMEHLENLRELTGIKTELPQVELQIYSTAEFSEIEYDLDDALFRQRIRVRRLSIDQAEKSTASADLILDIAMLQSIGFERLNGDIIDRHLDPYGVAYELRNCLFAQDLRQLHSSPPLAYPLTRETDRVLQFFLQNVFRKQTFRDGQLKIVRRALGRQPVIGLLPTGGGKSLCYQLAALLQPGMTMVIDPLVSLMMDQVDNLQSNFAIDWTLYINSMQDTKEREAAIDLMAAGRSMFIFISPERLQIQAFRERLAEVSSMIPIAYAVIDEAHCVSEWGHDFRTAYLRLARTIRRYCRHRNLPPALIALTGTASFAVLSDVQREIGIEDEDAQVYPESFDRRELQFGVIMRPSASKLNSVLEILGTHLPDALHSTKDSLLLPNGEGTAAGIIFTPHVNGKFGAKSVRNELAHRFPKADIRSFTGEDDAVEKTAVQNAFKRNEFALLVATKAFGMGIDKPNVRYTIHYNLPPSLESFYQEAGRAGRDQQPAYCWLVLSDDEPADANRKLNTSTQIEKEDPRDRTTSSPHDVDRLLWFHGNAFRGIKPELDEICQLYKKYIHPKLAKSQDKRATVEIPFNDGMSYDKYQNTQTNRDKALYRLSILGLVEDYTLDYNKRLFVVHVVHCEDKEYVANLQRYIRRYKTREVVEQVPDAVENEEATTTLGKCAAYLLRFVYEEIAAKRKAAIRTMLETARKAASLGDLTACSAFVREELLAYLEKSPFTEPLMALVKQTDFSDWKAVLELKDSHGVPLISSVDGLRQLLGGCRRMLESNLEHPGLLFLSSLARLLMPEPDVHLAQEEARRAFAALTILEPKRQREVVKAMVQEYRSRLRDTQDSKAQLQALADCALEAIPTRWLARDLINEAPMRSRELLLSFVLADIESLSSRLIV